MWLREPMQEQQLLMTADVLLIGCVLKRGRDKIKDYWIDY
jgi:hypothetical protein